MKQNKYDVKNVTSDDVTMENIATAIMDEANVVEESPFSLVGVHTELPLGIATSLVLQDNEQAQLEIYVILLRDDESE